MRGFLALAILTGCGGSSTGGATPTVSTTTGTTAPPPTDTGTPPVDTGPFELNGTVPPVMLAAPEFASVVNENETPVSRDDLLGHPTVLWFYPAATTGG